jgi:hypothetical protein
MAPIALLTIPGRRDPILSVSSQDFFHAYSREFFLALEGAWVKGVSFIFGLLSPLRL